MSTITAYPSRVRADATAFLVFEGQPWRTVEWSLTGTGSIEALQEYTDERGIAYAKYTPGTVGTSPVITVTMGVALLPLTVTRTLKWFVGPVATSRTLIWHVETDAPDEAIEFYPILGYSAFWVGYNPSKDCLIIPTSDHSAPYTVFAELDADSMSVTGTLAQSEETNVSSAVYNTFDDNWYFQGTDGSSVSRAYCIAGSDGTRAYKVAGPSGHLLYNPMVDPTTGDVWWVMWPGAGVSAWKKDICKLDAAGTVVQTWSLNEVPAPAIIGSDGFLYSGANHFTTSTTAKKRKLYKTDLTTGVQTEADDFSWWPSGYFMTSLITNSATGNLWVNNGLGDWTEFDLGSQTDPGPEVIMNFMADDLGNGLEDLNFGVYNDVTDSIWGATPYGNHLGEVVGLDLASSGDRVASFKQGDGVYAPRVFTMAGSREWVYGVRLNPLTSTYEIMRVKGGTPTGDLTYWNNFNFAWSEAG